MSTDEIDIHKDSRGYYPIHQKLSFTLYPLQKRASVLCEIRLRCTGIGFSQILLNARLSGLKSISLNERPLEFNLVPFEFDKMLNDLNTPPSVSPVQYPNKIRHYLFTARQKQELIINIPTDLFISEFIALKFHYELVDPSVGVNFLLERNEDDESFKYFQIIGKGSSEMARMWMPCFEGESIPWDLEYKISTDGIPSALIQQISVASSGALCQQHLNQEKTLKIFNFSLDIPTMPSMISFAIGIFDMVKIAAAPFAMAFCPMGYSTKLSLTVEFFSRSFGYINWYLGTTFPFPSYYVVFIKNVLAKEETLDAANVSMLSSSNLIDSTIIDQNLNLRSLLSESFSRQYFGIRLIPSGAESYWLFLGISGFLSRQILRTFHGNNDYRFSIKKDLESLLEVDIGKPSLNETGPFNFDPNFIRWLKLKSYLVLLILENRLEKGFLQKILSQLWSEFISEQIPKLSTVNFLKTAKKVSGKDLRSFAEQWIFSPGCPVFSCSFFFNRKKSTIEVDFKQSTPGLPQKKVIGTLLIRVHEIDGVFDHSVHIDDFSHRFELPVHAKAKKIKKKKKLLTPEQQQPGTIAPAQLVTKRNAQEAANPEEGAPGEEEESFVSPISWIRLDPEIEWISALEMHQPEHMLLEQLQNDRDVIAQHEAILSMRRQPSDTVIQALERILNDPKCFYKIRVDAANGLALCSTSPDTHLGGLRLISFYNKNFAIISTETVVVPLPKSNNFENLQNYFVLKAIAPALAKIRTKNATLMELTGQIMLNLLRFNDNAGNQFSDNYHVATLITSFVDHLKVRSEISLPMEKLTREFIRELDRYSILERIQPYYSNTVMVSIIQAWRELFKLNSLPANAKNQIEALLRDGNYIDVRLASLDFLLTTETEATPILVRGIEKLLLTPNRAVLSAACERLSAFNGKSITCRSSLSNENNKERFLTILSHLSVDVSLSYKFLLFTSQIIDSMAGDTLDGRISIRLNIPTNQHDLGSDEEHPLIVSHAEEEPDWLLEITGEQELPKPPRPFASAVKLRLPNNAVSPLPSSLMDRLLNVHNNIWNNFDSFPFRFPVDKSVAGYYDVVKEPIDLNTIKERLLANPMDANLRQFCEDLRLMFENCFFFNQPESLIVEQAKRLRMHSLKELKKVFPESSKEVRQILMAKEPAPASIVPFVSIPEKRTAAAAAATATPPKELLVPQKKEVIPPPVEIGIEEKMQSIIQKVKEHPYSFWFLQPVDPVALNIPTYLEIIKEPMDLSTLQQQLESDEFVDQPEEFLRRLDLIFTNCTTFNPVNTIVHQNALEMRKFAMKIVKKILPDVGSGVAPPSLELPNINLSQAKKNNVKKPSQLKLKITLPIPSSSPPTTDRGWYKPAEKILDQICNHECSSPFLQPVDPIALKIPSYPKIIKNPMDLSTVRVKLEKREYKRPAEFNRDFKLMFNNCYKFNGKEAPISEMARALESYYDSLYLKSFCGEDENL